MSTFSSPDVLPAMVAQVHDSRIASSELLPAGGANHVYSVVLENGPHLIVRILKTQTPKGALREHHIQQTLSQAGFHTPNNVLLRSGEIVGEVNGLFFTTSEYLPGKTTSAVTDKLAINFGVTLAKFHTAMQELDLGEHKEWLNYAVFQEQLPKLNDSDLILANRLTDGTDILFSSGLPLANIHGDLMLNNFLSRTSRFQPCLISRQQNTTCACLILPARLWVSHKNATGTFMTSRG